MPRFSTKFNGNLFRLEMCIEIDDLHIDIKARVQD